MSALLAGNRMAKMGRPTAGSEREGPTKAARLYEQDWELAYWVSEVLGIGMAEVLRPIVRPALTARYNQHRAQIEQLKELKAAERKLKDEAAARQTDAPAPPPESDVTPPKRRRSGG